jgi:hypothetical protein
VLPIGAGWAWRSHDGQLFVVSIELTLVLKAVEEASKMLQTLHIRLIKYETKGAKMFETCRTSNTLTLQGGDACI